MILRSEPTLSQPDSLVVLLVVEEIRLLKARYFRMMVSTDWAPEVHIDPASAAHGFWTMEDHIYADGYHPAYLTALR
ncbi:MAG: hypothetical protein C0482_21295 [Gordonia sp.]|nr:hypothetical protein [Gordonia sp. (in: high G+C Gram-positive bacteria)]